MSLLAPARLFLAKIYWVANSQNFADFLRHPPHFATDTNFHSSYDSLLSLDERTKSILPAVFHHSLKVTTTSGFAAGVVLFAALLGLTIRYRSTK